MTSNSFNRDQIKATTAISRIFSNRHFIFLESPRNKCTSQPNQQFLFAADKVLGNISRGTFGYSRIESNLITTK